MKRIYLDSNATTRVADEVLEAMLPWLREEMGNPSSAHTAGVVARDAIEAGTGVLLEAGFTDVSEDTVITSLIVGGGPDYLEVSSVVLGGGLLYD